MSVKDWPDLAGRLQDGRHTLPVRVYFEDTDFTGVVYHASYFRWCERGRSDFLRLAGVAHRDLAAGQNGEPSGFAVRRITADFVKPARIDDILIIETSIDTLTKASVTIAQTVVRGGDVLCRLQVQCVLVSFEGRLIRLPAAFLDSLQRPQVRPPYTNGLKS